jgi:outer membrane lipoprotein-sorting protein
VLLRGIPRQAQSEAARRSIDKFYARHTPNPLSLLRFLFMKLHISLTCALVAFALPAVAATTPAQAPAKATAPAAPAPAPAPDEKTAPPTAEVVPAPPAAPEEPRVIEPAAVALIDKAVAGYTALKSMSFKFTAVDSEKGQTPHTASGTLSLRRPNLGRLVTDTPQGRMELVATPKTVYILSPSKVWQTLAAPADGVMGKLAGSIPSAASIFLASMIEGHNPAQDSEIKWQKVQLIPGPAGSNTNGVLLTAPSSPELTSLTFALYFDAKNSLLRRAEAKAEAPGHSFSNSTVFTELRGNPAFGPKEFVFTPPPGAKRMTGK